MVEYTLNIRIDPYWVNYYNQYEWQFCFARNSTSSGSPTTMNVSKNFQLSLRGWQPVC